MLNKNKLYKVANCERPYAFRANLFMWPGLTFFLGPLQQLEFHAMGAVAINIGLYQPFYMKGLDGMYQPYRFAIIPAGYRHDINAFDNIVACLIIEKNSIDFTQLRHKISRQKAGKVSELSNEWLECFQTIYQERPAKSEIKQMLYRLLGVDENNMPNNMDPRIVSALETIRLNPDINLKQQTLATSVGLSSSRFRHLFHEQTDVSFRRYRMWRRVVSAMGTLHQVDNLTYAAMEAGFTDSAHFNRCFRDTLGVNPSLVFRSIDRFEVDT